VLLADLAARVFREELARVEPVRRDEALADDGDRAGRLRILAGGCSGLEYRLDLLQPGERPEDGERELVSNGVRLLMDLKSSIHVTGPVIDYESTLLPRGFKLKNPNPTDPRSLRRRFGG